MKLQPFLIDSVLRSNMESPQLGSGISGWLARMGMQIARRLWSTAAGAGGLELFFRSGERSRRGRIESIQSDK